MEHPFLSSLYYANIVYTILVILIIYLMTSLIRRFVNKNVTNLKKRHKIRKVTFYAAYVILIIALLEIWTTSIPSFTTILSFVGAGLALALHEVVLCVAGWVLINIKRPYEIGDRIEVDGKKGDVIDIGVFQTMVIEVGNWVDADQSTGRIISIPNSVVFRHAVYNYNKEFPFIWHEIPILVTFETNWKKAQEIILHAAAEDNDEVGVRMKTLIERMAHHYMVQYKKFTPVVYVTVRDSGVLLTLRYLTDAKKRRSSEDAIIQKILSNFSTESDIDFAYPTTRFYRAPEEGKQRTQKQ